MLAPLATMPAVEGVAAECTTGIGPGAEARHVEGRGTSAGSDRQKNRHTEHGKVWREKRSASRVSAALPSPPATKALDPDLFSRLSLRHAVCAALLHIGFESAATNTFWSMHRKQWGPKSRFERPTY